MNDIERWIHAKRILREHRKEALKELSLTEQALRELEDAALSQLRMTNAEEIATADGVAYLEERPAFMHKHSEPFGIISDIKFREA